MREIYTYAFFDESFLSSIDWDAPHTLKVQEAVSQNWQRLVTTLIPNLLKAVHVHAPEFDAMNFFEWARIWPYYAPQGASKGGPEGLPESEQSSLAGIFVNQKKRFRFLCYKQKLCKLASLLKIKFDWIKADAKDLQPWYLPYQTAYLMHEGTKIGVAGKINPAFFSKIAMGDAFIFELDGNFLLTHHAHIPRYMPAHKYPGITRDVSMLIPLALTVAELRDGLQKLDSKIESVTLLDFFQKPEWKDQKSLTFRIEMVDPSATMTTAQADAIMKKVTEYLQKHGAIIR